MYIVNAKLKNPTTEKQALMADSRLLTIRVDPVDYEDLNNLDRLKKDILEGVFDGVGGNGRAIYAVEIGDDVYFWLKGIDDTTFHKALIFNFAWYNAKVDSDNGSGDWETRTEITEAIDRLRPFLLEVKRGCTCAQELHDAYVSAFTERIGCRPPDFLVPFGSICLGEPRNNNLLSFNGTDFILKVIRSRADQTDPYFEKIYDSSEWDRFKYAYTQFLKTGKPQFKPTFLGENDTKGYVYLIRSESDLFIKIGWTRVSVEARLAGLQTGNSNKLILQGFFEATSSAAEKNLHSIFSGKRVRHNGEWFRLSDEDVKNILDMKWRHSNGIV